MGLQVNIGPVIFKQYTEKGFLIGPDGLTGWHDGVSIRRDTMSRAQANGSFEAPGYLDSRLITISGYCLTDRPSELLLFQQRIQELFANGGSQRIIVREDQATSYAIGHLAGKLSFKAMQDGRTAGYQVQFWCADPRKFGTIQPAVSGTTVAVNHYGNFDAAPTIKVSGSMPGYTINGPDFKGFTVSTAVTSGHPHTIDMNTGLLYIDGSVRFGAVSRGDTWVVPSNQTVTQVLNPVSGSGTMSVQVTDTFI